MVKTFMTIAGLLLCVAGGVQAQDRVQVQGTSPDLYVLHTVKKGETFYSLGRSYSLSPKEIASENNISFEQGLQLGQSIKIPLSNTNFSQKSDAGGTPVYHKVEEKETLYRLSVNHNKVSLDNIRHWNNMSGDGLQKDSYVIVGYLKGSGIPSSAPVVTAPATTPPPATHPVSTPPAATPAPATPAPTTPVTTTPPASTTPTPVPPATKPDQPAPSEPVKAPEANTGGPKTTPTAGASFEQLYNQQTGNGKNVTAEKGPGGWFKSNASAGKYYALHNSAPRGTIIKVTNPLNGKFIYAKVLEAIPQIKQNEGLIIKLSDSALEALGTNEAKFYCQLNYEE
jgi:LysM repeat protein